MQVKVRCLQCVVDHQHMKVMLRASAFGITNEFVQRLLVTSTEDFDDDSSSHCLAHCAEG